jgi:hypothetical protein
MYSKDLASVPKHVYYDLRALLISSAARSQWRSKLKLVENYLHTKMDPERMIDLAIISMQRDLSSKVKLSLCLIN